MTASGYWSGAWPGEDGGPRRRQTATGGLGLEPGDRLEVTERDVFAATMLVTRDPGELFLLRHTLGARIHRDPTIAWVERIDPHTLAPLGRSPDLAGGPFWPGGLAAHANGSLVLVHGRHAHRLDATTLEPIASRQLPAPRPHNSFVLLPGGELVTKDFDRRRRAPARMLVLDPKTLATIAEAELPEPAIARLSADGDDVYAVGITTAFRYRFDRAAATLERDPGWSHRYRTLDGQGHGWDPVIAAGHAWFLDNGDHDYLTTMLGAARDRGPVRLHRVSLADRADHEAVEVCGEPRGAVTNPPVYDERRRIAVAHDAANGVLAAFDHPPSGPLALRWRMRLNHAAHHVLFAETGELVVMDFAPRLRVPRSLSPVARAGAGLMRSERVRRATAGRDEVVVLDVETGEERGRAPVRTAFQSVLFPAPGRDRDVYAVSFSTLARIRAPG